MGKRFFYVRLAWSNIKKNSRIYLPYILSCIGTVAMYYIMSALAPAINEENMFGGGSVVSMLQFGAVIMLIFAAIFLFYTNSFIIKQRKNEFGLYSILGMEKKHIAYVAGFETLLISFGSILSGLLLGVLLCKLMFLILERLVQSSSSIQFVIPLSAVGSTIGLFLIIFSLTLLYNILQILRSNPIALLNSGNAGEREPKANWLLAILGILFLGVGYALSLSIKNPIEALMFFFIAVVLVIFGTYCLFTAGMTALLKLLKRRKSYYYKPRHFTTVSGMLYRMKQNAAGLSTICILSTCVLVMISSTFAMYTGLEDIMATRFPEDFSISEMEASSAKARENSRIISGALSELQIEPLRIREKYVYDCYSFATDTGFQIMDPSKALQSLGDASYLEFTTPDWVTAGEWTLPALKADALYCYNQNGNYPADTLDLFGQTMTVKPLPESILEAFDQKDFDDRYHIILADTAALNRLLDRVAASGLDAVYPRYSYSFDVEADASSQKELAFALRQRIADTDLYLDSRATAQQDFLETFGGLFFLGIFLGLSFIMALVLIIYYKQISEGYDDRNRFVVMQKVGMSHQEVKESIRNQILLVFFLPLLMSVIHLAFAMPMLIRILALMNLINQPLILLSAGGVVLIFILIYVVVYLRTARSYYKIVEA